MARDTQTTELRRIADQLIDEAAYLKPLGIIRLGKQLREALAAGDTPPPAQREQQYYDSSEIEQLLAEVESYGFEGEAGLLKHAMPWIHLKQAIAAVGRPAGIAKLKEACEFAHGAIGDAICLEDGLDGAAGQKVMAMIDAALVANGYPALGQSGDRQCSAAASVGRPAPPAKPRVGVCFRHKHAEWQGCYTSCGYCHQALQYVSAERAEQLTGRKRPEWWPEKMIGYKPADAPPEE